MFNTAYLIGIYFIIADTFDIDAMKIEADNDLEKELHLIHTSDAIAFYAENLLSHSVKRYSYKPRRTVQIMV